MKPREKDSRGGPQRRGAVLLSLFALAACSSLPKIAGATLPADTSTTQPIYRDLADIPQPPSITSPAANNMTIDALAQERASTAQAADDLRRQPFMQPDNDAKPGF